ncbi:hypothetical protein ACFV9E_39060 [Streptomyces sp. NPDC059835]|uniref:hypothetical protein n=1 Tax=Streptomyces sp. NPDC059835 TaxID=3346967 RepID=UPI00365F0430
MLDPLSAAQMRTLVRDALGAALDTDASTVPSSLMYTAGSGHRAVLYADTTVVRAVPGMGKTFWARTLTDSQRRSVAAREFQMPRLERTAAVVAFGSEPGPVQVGPDELAALVDEGAAPVMVWTAIALTALGVTEMTVLPDWGERVAWLTRNPGALERSVAALDSAAQSVNGDLVVVFDSLDRLHPDRTRADGLASGILQFAHDLAQLRTRVHAKVFMRPDMWDSASPVLTPAARRSLRPVDLSWSAARGLRWASTSLYGLLFHLLGNHDSAEAAAFRAMTPTWREAPDGRFAAPDALCSDVKAQEAAFSLIADPYMGANARKGYSYRWLPVALQDALGQATPRSFLATLHQAAIHADGHPGHGRALHHEDIRRGWQEGVRVRARELDGTLPWVREALAALSGEQVPIEEERVFALWEQAGLLSRLRDRGGCAGASVTTGPRSVDSHPALLDELIELGIATRRTSGLIDLPDLYRFLHGLGRRGGVKHVAHTA